MTRMFHRQPIPWLASLLMLLSTCTALGMPLVVDRHFTEMPIQARNMEVLEDPSGQLTFKNIQAPETAARFHKLSSSTTGFGLSRSHFWLRFSVDYLDTAQTHYVIVQRNPLTDNIILYRQNENGDAIASATGGRLRFAHREFPTREFAWSVPANPYTRDTYWVEFYGLGALDIDLELTTLHAAWGEFETGHLVMGLYFGGTLCLLFYNLFIYVSVRDRSYLYYLLYLVSGACLFFGMNGLGFRYWWPNSRWWNEGYMLFAFTGFLGMLQFTRNFLHTDHYSQPLNRWLKTMAAASAIAATGVIWIPRSIIFTVANFATILVSLTCLYAGVSIWRRRYRPARYYVISWLSIMTGIVIYALKNFGVLPYNPLTHYAAQLGSFMEMLLLSLAMGDRMALLQTEKLAAEVDTKAKILAANMALEETVKARTNELSSNMQALAQQHEQLKKTEQQLVQAEKMSSLGSVVSGVAHELRNPANFVQISNDNLQRELGQLHSHLHSLADEESDSELLLQLDSQFKRLKEHLHLVTDGTGRITRIVNDLRTFSRMDEAKMQSASPSSSLESTLRLVEAQFGEQVQFVLHDNTGDTHLLCHPLQLGQVYMNLLVNGCQAIQEKQHMQGKDSAIDKGIIEIETGLADYKSTPHWFVRFRDSGTGISAKIQQRIFDPFFTTKDVGSGTGLGLSVSYGIIMHHHGHIEVSSEPGTGATFTLWLPLQPQPEAPVETHPH